MPVTGVLPVSSRPSKNGWPVTLILIEMDDPIIQPAARLLSPRSDRANYARHRADNRRRRRIYRRRSITSRKMMSYYAFPRWLSSPHRVHDRSAGGCETLFMASLAIGGIAKW